MSMQAIEKVLSANDIGATGGHQAGIYVPKAKDILSFFPVLNASVINPREVLDVTDSSGRIWAFPFIYYNNRFFGGTRNEFRLTGMTAFIREFNLKAGDKIILKRESLQKIYISFVRGRIASKVIRLSSSWKVIDADF